MKSETKLQFPMFAPDAEWTAPKELPDLTQAKTIAVDLNSHLPQPARVVLGVMHHDFFRTCHLFF